MEANLLARVRALLAKAESTAYEAEAEAFNAKAVELIAKYGIDEALLAASGAKTDTIASRVIDIDNPYAMEKATLLNAVAKSLRCQALATRARKGGPVNIVTLVGYSSDLERVTLIYTSLLLQATTQVTRQRPRDNSQTSTVAFRRSWWVGFSTAVRARLVEAERRAAEQTVSPTPGTSTELVLRDRTALVRDAFRELFPRTRTSRAPSATSGDGYRNGRTAGERADLGARRVGPNRRELQ